MAVNADRLPELIVHSVLCYDYREPSWTFRAYGDRLDVYVEQDDKGRLGCRMVFDMCRYWHAHNGVVFTFIIDEPKKRATLWCFGSELREKLAGEFTSARPDLILKCYNGKEDRGPVLTEKTKRR